MQPMPDRRHDSDVTIPPQKCELCNDDVTKKLLRDDVMQAISVEKHTVTCTGVVSSLDVVDALIYLKVTDEKLKQKTPTV